MTIAETSRSRPVSAAIFVGEPAAGIEVGDLLTEGALGFFKRQPSRFTAMDVTAIAAALMGAQLGQQQVVAAEAMLRMNADAPNAVAKMLDQAQQSVDSLANVASGVGTNLNISV
jgi:cell pole-organizing protein PopZ